MKANPKDRIYWHRGPIEVGTGAPGYRWVDGYSENNPEGAPLYPWATKQVCRDAAKADGCRAVFKTMIHAPSGLAVQSL